MSYTMTVSEFRNGLRRYLNAPDNVAVEFTIARLKFWYLTASDADKRKASDMLRDDLFSMPLSPPDSPRGGK